jgi:hypothetical protein
MCALRAAPPVARRPRCGAPLPAAAAAGGGAPPKRPSEPKRKSGGGGQAATPAKQAGGGSKSGFAASPAREKRAPLPPAPAAPPRPPPPPPPPPPRAPEVAIRDPDAAALAALPALAAGPPLPDATCLAFERRGHVALRGLLSADELAALAPGVLAALDARRVDALRTGVRCALGEAALRDDFGLPYEDADELEALLAEAGANVPFLQVFNAWRDGCAAARRLACSARLVGAAADLLGCDPAAVRLYQDAVFAKRAGDAPTRWHADLAMAPLDTNSLLTLWLPLQPVPSRADGGTGLDYAAGSHRDVALHYHEQDLSDLDGRFALENHGALAPGDVCAHHGWTLHGAPGMASDEVAGTRVAFTASYFVDGARLLEEPLGPDGPGGRDGFDEDAESYAGWVVQLGGGALAAHAAVPLALSVSPR